MRFAPALLSAALMILFTALPGARADQTYVSMTFDDKTIDAPIGTGGPALGEPEWVDEGLEAIVRAEPFETPSLEIHSSASTGVAQSLGFTISAVNTGIVAIIMDVWADGYDAFWFDFYNSSYQIQTKILFDKEGTLHINNYYGEVASLPEYPTGRSVPILIVMDCDMGLFSVWVDGEAVATDETLASPGLRAVYFVAGYNVSLDSRFRIDQIRILDFAPDVPAETLSWGKLHWLFH